VGKIIDTDPDRIKGKYDGPDPILVLDNWRIIRESEHGLIVVINTCERFFIPNLTMKEFHDINDTNETVKRSFEYVEENITCMICHGIGVLHWVDNITKNVKYEDGMMLTFKRNPSTPSRELDDYYVSTPMLDMAQTLCETCHGTGLHMFNENAYLLKVESERSHS